MSKPSTYFTQAGCHSCLFGRPKTHPDQGTQFFCTVDGVEPPKPWPSIVASMPYDEAVEDAYHAATDDWEKDREVEAHGMCLQYLQRQPQAEDPACP